MATKEHSRPATRPSAPPTSEAELGLSKWSGPRHNVALAECAAVEERSVSTIDGHVAQLRRSPMFRFLVEDFAFEDDQEWDLALFAARLFYAGIIAGRAEDGQRDNLGDLIHDAPWRAERQDVPVNPAQKSGGR